VRPDLVKRFDELNTWQRRDQSAPHKPLLSLWAIGRCLQGRERLVTYDIVERDIGLLLRKFGSGGTSNKPYEPFWRMRKDRIWEVTEAHKVSLDSRGSAYPKQLRKHKVRGGFPAPIYDCLKFDVGLALMITQRILDAHFCTSKHKDILVATFGDYAFEAVSLLSVINKSEHLPNINTTLARRARSFEFQERVIEIYRNSCAVCNFSFEFPDGCWPALEAAHIKWQSHQGPDNPNNGLSLCVLHRELFDRGLFTIEPNSLRIQVADAVLERVPKSPITDFHQAQLPIVPSRIKDRPAEEYLSWHAEQVFWGS